MHHYAQIGVEGYKRGTAFSINLRIPPRYWQLDDADAPVNPAYYRAAQLNAKLREMRTTLADLQTALAVMHQECSPAILKQLWQQGGFQKKKMPTLLEVHDQLVNSKRDKGRQEFTLTTNKTRRQNIEAFLNEIHSILIFSIN